MIIVEIAAKLTSFSKMPRTKIVHLSQFPGIYAIHAWSSSVYTGNTKRWGPMNGWTIRKGWLFISKMESNPWVRFQLNKDTIITSITVANRKDCCGGRLVNLEIRAGMANNMNNQLVGLFKGPGQTNKEYTFRLFKKVKARYISILMRAKGYLQINGIKLNLHPIMPRPTGNIQKITFINHVYENIETHALTTVIRQQSYSNHINFFPQVQ